MPTSISLELAVHFANGDVVRYYGSPDVTEIAVPPGEAATLEAIGQFDFGLTDIQLWVGTKSCVEVSGFVQCSGPGVLGRPTARNPWKRGEPKTTERRVSQVVRPYVRGVRSKSFEVTAVAIGPGRDPERLRSVWIVAGDQGA